MDILEQTQCEVSISFQFISDKLDKISMGSQKVQETPKAPFFQIMHVQLI